jgi:hypothetical protein
VWPPDDPQAVPKIELMLKLFPIGDVKGLVESTTLFELEEARGLAIAEFGETPFAEGVEPPPPRNRKLAVVLFIAVLFGKLTLIRFKEVQTSGSG